MRIAVSILCMLLVAAGCAESPGLRGLGDENAKGISGDFPGKSPRETLDAAARLFKLVSDTGVGFYTWPNGMICQRKYKTLGALSAGGSFDFHVTVEEKEDGARATLRITRTESSSAGTVMPSDPGNHLPGPSLRNPVSDVTAPGAYKLFFDRMKSLLYGDPWVACREAEHDPRYGGEGLDPLCRAADDRSP